MKADEKKCPKCAEVIKKAATVCKHCGHTYSAEEIAQERRNEAAANKATGIGCLVIIGLLLLMAACGAIFGGDDEDSTTTSSARKAEEKKEMSDVETMSGFQVLAKQKMEETLRDPGSAKYQDVYAHKIGDGNFIFCGRVNAKNGFGGYTGFERFVASPLIVGTEGSVDDFAQVWNEFCTSSTQVQKVWF